MQDQRPTGPLHQQQRVRRQRVRPLVAVGLLDVGDGLLVGGEQRIAGLQVVDRRPVERLVVGTHRRRVRAARHQREDHDAALVGDHLVRRVVRRVRRDRLRGGGGRGRLVRRVVGELGEHERDDDWARGGGVGVVGSRVRELASLRPDVRRVGAGRVARVHRLPRRGGAMPVVARDTPMERGSSVVPELDPNPQLGVALVGAGDRRVADRRGVDGVVREDPADAELRREKVLGAFVAGERRPRSDRVDHLRCRDQRPVASDTAERAIRVRDARRRQRRLDLANPRREVGDGELLALLVSHAPMLRLRGDQSHHPRDHRDEQSE